MNPGFIIRCQLARITDQGVHDRRDFLARAIGMIQPQRMPQLMQKNALDIADAFPLRIELQISSIGVED